ncbi:PaaI family thioesterase [Aquabacter sp. CN5-332]|uniref:PaaI family thioesterase n=1 Tax=Aquabacter sp. CN5-332 TaxID=3156608 RepID=UPI0032B4600D
MPGNMEIDDAAFISALLARPPLHQWLSPEIIALDAEKGTIAVKLPYRSELSRSPDQRDYHGGIIATLVDIAGHTCLAARLKRRVPTIDMRVDYLRGALDTDLIAEARIIRAGRTVGVCDVDIRDDQGRAIAAGRCVYSTRED